MKKQTKIDKETRTMLTEQEQIRNLTLHEGWPIVRKMVLKKVGELMNIADVNIVNKGALDLAQEIGMRQIAAARLIEILNEIQGTAEQFDANSALTEEINEGYILRQAPISGMRPNR